MKLSIITINYNNLEGLRRTINSVLSQTWTDFEWIIVDGGSTDGSRVLIDQHEEHFAYWCSEPDKGVYNAMNKGIAHAQGEYMIFMNSGDAFFDMRVLENVFKEPLNHDIVYGSTQIVRGEITSIYNPPQEITLDFLYQNTINHQSFFIKSSVQKELMYDENYKIVSDRKLLLQCLISGKSFHKVDYVIASYPFDGYSSIHIIEGNEELESVRKELLPDSVLSVVKTLIDMRQEKQDFPELPLLKRLIEENKFYRKIVNKILHLFLIINQIKKI